MRTTTTDRALGDFAIDAESSGLDRRRRGVVDLPWVWLRQVHGSEVLVVVPESIDEVRGQEGDALVTTATGLVLAVQTADCVPVVLWSDEGVIGVAHAGWRGVEAGIVEAAAASMRRLGATSIHASFGPHLGVSRNEFGTADLDRLADQFGDGVRGTTLEGRPAFDIDAALARAVERADISVKHRDQSCTATDAERWFSHRARGDLHRMATIIWRDPVAS